MSSGLTRMRDFASGLDRVALFDTLEGHADLFEGLQALEVVLHGVAPRARPCGADGVGGCDEERLRAGVVVVVVLGDGGDDRLRHLVLHGDIRPDLGVGTLDLVGQGLADVVEQPAPSWRRGR